jgi:hypothetical protein
VENRKEKIEEFIIFFEENNFDSKNITDFMAKYKVSALLKKILGYLLIILSLGVIIIPLPHVYEIATIYYFNYNDGITLSDLIALLVLLVGIYLVLRNKIYFGNIID